MKPVCSVVLTTYERADHLSLTLRSLARQSRRDFELIVADDGSGSTIFLLTILLR